MFVCPWKLLALSGPHMNTGRYPTPWVAGEDPAWTQLCSTSKALRQASPPHLPPLGASTGWLHPPAPMGSWRLRPGSVSLVATSTKSHKPGDFDSVPALEARLLRWRYAGLAPPRGLWGDPAAGCLLAVGGCWQSRGSSAGRSIPQSLPPSSPGVPPVYWCPNVPL